MKIKEIQLYPFCLMAVLLSLGVLNLWDGVSYNVYGQRYDASDQSIDNEFRVNTNSTGSLGSISSNVNELRN